MFDAGEKIVLKSERRGGGTYNQEDKGRNDDSAGGLHCGLAFSWLVVGSFEHTKT